MKTETNSPKSQQKKRLAAYSAAVGLGAFTCGESAEAAIIHVDGPDIVVSSGSGGYYDMNGDTVPDFRFRHTTSGSGSAAIRFQGTYGSADLTNSPAKGSTYYVRSFEFGDLIGPSTPSTGPASGIVRADAVNFGDETDPQYAGIALLIGGNTHYGWVRLKTEPVDSGGQPDPPLTGTIFEWAYESTPNTAIAAGATVPEPSSLALLAAGAGALALRRRKSV